MPRKGITGHDEWVVTEALATAFVALEQLPDKHQPRAHPLRIYEQYGISSDLYG
jgi:hypothetical protein